MKKILLLIAVLFILSCVNKTRSPEMLKVFEQDNRFGYCNAQDKVVIPPRFYLAQPFNRFGIAAVADDSGWCYINTTGKVVIRPFIYDNGQDYFSEGLARFTWNGKFGYFDESGKVVIEAQFDFAAPFSEGMAAVCQSCTLQQEGEHRFYQGGKWGFIDHRGNPVIPFHYDMAHSFENGKARIKLPDGWHTIDKTGKVVE